MQAAPIATQARRLLVGILVLGSAGVLANHTPLPSAAGVPGSFQSELGCTGDWQPECAATQLVYDTEDDVWQATFAVPAGTWEYKVALNGSWSENYGGNATANGPNIPLELSSGAAVKFYYDHKTHWIADNRNEVIATAPGSFQSELGCASDWDPTCLRSWLQDPDGDGIYTFSTDQLPAGSYEVKVAIGESWSENYGAGGVRDGANIAFTVGGDCAGVHFAYDAATHVLTVSASSGDVPQPSTVTIPGSLQSELGCAGDWQPDCAATGLTFDAVDRVWQGTFNVPSGAWEYKAAINNSWDENYGANAQRNGANIGLALAAPRAVKFYYDHASHWVTDNVNEVIATAPGNFQSELGCPGDWQPDCLRSWLQDPDGDGLYTFTTHALPAGNYEVKVAINESWDENYGAGGLRDGPNIAFAVARACAAITFVYDSATHVLTVGELGAPRGNLSKARAHWVAADQIAWRADGRATPDASWTVRLHYASEGGLRLTNSGVTGGVEIPLVHDPAGLSADLRERFPHLAIYPVFRVPAGRVEELKQALKGQLAISAVGSDGAGVDATSLQIPGVLDDLYRYDGPLGPTFEGGVPALRVWAPTARSIKLHLFDTASAAPSATLPMSPDATTGVWQLAGDPSWSGKFYLYEVEVYVRSTGRVERNFVTDPYSVSLSRNSQRSQIVDLNDPSLAPAGWSSLKKGALAAPEDIVLYELHVRDFSANDATVPEPLRGTFMAFTETSSDGMQHLAALARAGLSHVHLLPAFDLASVDEDKALWQSPGDLSAFPPESDQQQAAVMAVADRDAYNWGYDPWHYTVPEGSYSTNPDGPTRTLEFRQMVQRLNEAGLRVVMDVVYNHTTASGQNSNSVLDRVVPGYYHRLNGDGDVETSTCCQNTATEHRMMEKLMVDSVVTWARQYKVDGFRFDLMGHHMKRNMQAVRAALDALTIERDGVAGRETYVYGEGWNFGEVADGARGVNATQRNMAGTGIGSFNDRIRDGARGGGPFSGLQEQGFLTGLSFEPNGTPQGSPDEQRARLLQQMDWIRVSLAGNLAEFEFRDRFGSLVRGDAIDYQGQPAGYTADPQEVINYVEAHDDETLFDAIQLKAAPSASVADRVRMQKLGVSLVLLGQGVPFIHAGAELLRSKSLDRNSYNSGDWFNRLDFTYATNNWGVGLPPARDNQSNWPVMQALLANPDLRVGSAEITSAFSHVREALQIRRSTRLFRLRTQDEIRQRLRFHNTGPEQTAGLIVMAIGDETGQIDRQHDATVVLLNARPDAVTFSDPAIVGRALTLHPVQAASADPFTSAARFDPAGGTFQVPPRTAAVFWSVRPIAAQIALLEGDVASLQSRGVLSKGRAQSLTAKLAASQGQLARGGRVAASNQLGAFVNEVEAFIRAGILTAADGQALIDEAEAIRSQLDER